VGSSTDVVVNALKQLRMATYDSLQQYDSSYSLDTYKVILKELEARSQVKKLIFRAGTQERYVWILPWYEDEAKEEIGALRTEVIEYLGSTPATSRQIREYFKEKHSAHHQIAYLAVRQLASEGRLEQIQFNEGQRWISIYYLPEKRPALDDLLKRSLAIVNSKGSAFAHDLQDSMGISLWLASALLATLAYQKHVMRFKVGWSYSRNKPVFAYCAQGQEDEAVRRYRKSINELQKKQRKLRLVEEYSSKFLSACREMRSDEALADLAIAYFDRTARSAWLKGRDSKILAWSAFFLASKTLRKGITPGEVEAYSKVEKRALVMNAKELNDFLQLNVPDLYPHPTDFVERIIARMELPARLTTTGGATRIDRGELLEETKRFLLSLPRSVSFGKRGESLAAASLYLTASRLGIFSCTQARISTAADITEVTLRNTLRLIENIRPALAKLASPQVVGGSANERRE
jgi:transcription initiation factor TFIIIB Brf1 subunit/transcription initiation factor TFIIB